MNEVPILFTQKWKIGISLVVILALTFLDKITPPFGIPIAVLGVFVLFRWRKLPIKLIGLFAPKSWLLTIIIGVSAGLLIQALSVFVIEPALAFFVVAQETPAFYKTVEGNNSMLVVYLLVSWTTKNNSNILTIRRCTY